PRTALAIMGQEVEAIKKAVVTGDTEFFAQVPRLGKKNAQKIIIELRPKLGSIGEFDLSGQSGETKDVIDALLVMGFAKREIIEALAKIPKDKTGAEDKIREVLRVLGKR
ncbi:hypothetical protein HYS11_00535, partial [Candidatus Gottesmanbacteria bacterium]|nr:hypothetical protein [Candidatus Gottesmanbacteria bacterium]